MKIQDILDMDTPETQIHVREFIGMVNFYKHMWPKQSTILTPLTNLTGKGTKFIWREAHDKAFKEMKRQIAKSAMLAFPNFDLLVDLYTDASDNQIGACLIQRKESEFPIGYFARKFNSVQSKYAVTEKELLSIVEGLKYFRTIIYGHRVTAHSDHRNLTYENSDYSTDRILRQRLVIEEYVAESIKYILGIKNTAADALSRIPTRVQPDQEYYEFQISCPSRTQLRRL